MKIPKKPDVKKLPEVSVAEVMSFTNELQKELESAGQTSQNAAKRLQKLSGSK